MAVTPTVVTLGTTVNVLTLAAGATGGLNPASTIDPVNDYLSIYTASATATQGINRNTLLNLTSQPTGISDTQTISNKTINNTNTLTIKDSSLTLQNASDVTKQGIFSLAGLTTGNTRTYTLPNYNATLATLAGTETLTEKTLTSPTINSPTITNASITADSVTGYTTSNAGSIYGVAVSSGLINGASITGNGTILPAVLATAIPSSKFSIPSNFSVYLSNGHNLTSTIAVIPFDTKTFDTGTNVDVVTNKGRFTAPTTGFYIFSWNLNLPNVAQSFNIQLYKNGSVLQGVGAGLGSTSTDIQFCGSSLPIQLSAGNYIEIWGSCTATNGLVTGAVNCSFGGYLLGTS